MTILRTSPLTYFFYSTHSSSVFRPKPAMNRSVLFVLFSTFYFVIAERPNIVFILADDLGWNDVGFHGSNFIPTPNIDALAYTGIILDKYYVTPICTPSRSALMTGKYPIHTGMQHGVLKYAEPRGLPLTEKLLPQYLKELDYRTHIVGKWHLGMYKKDYTPLYRGFDSHLGFWGGRIDYYDHTSEEYNQWGLDMRRGMEPAWDLHGQYITDLFTKESVKIIKNHDLEKPLFLYLAHGATHSANPYDPLQINNSEPLESCNVTTYLRSRFAGMVKRLDESVKKVVEALDQKGILQNSIIIFSSDNGGPAAGFNFNQASNWPLRGVKNTNYEGGVRASGLVWSPKLTQDGRVSKQMMHITDWLPTLLSAAGYNSSSLNHLDGIDMWETLRTQSESKRNVVLHNIDGIYGTSAITVGPWKLMQGSTYGKQWNGWYGPSERDNYYDTNKIKDSQTAKILSKIGFNLEADKMLSLRHQTMFDCPKKDETLPSCAPDKIACLTNVELDPCESNNLSAVYPEILQMLENELEKFNQTAMKPGSKPLDPRSNPANWDNVWTNYGDHLKDYQSE